jgi:hypothetical protein
MGLKPGIPNLLLCLLYGNPLHHSSIGRPHGSVVCRSAPEFESAHVCYCAGRGFATEAQQSGRLDVGFATGEQQSGLLEGSFATAGDELGQLDVQSGRPSHSGGRRACAMSQKPGGQTPDLQRERRKAPSGLSKATQWASEV